MAPGSDAETQFRFLLSCIRHSVAGKVRSQKSPIPSASKHLLTSRRSQVDFGAVAEELEIVSKAAA